MRKLGLFFLWTLVKPISFQSGGGITMGGLGLEAKNYCSPICLGLSFARKCQVACVRNSDFRTKWHYELPLIFALNWSSGWFAAKRGKWEISETSAAKYCVNYEICFSLKQNDIETCVTLKTNKCYFSLPFKLNSSFKDKLENTIVST